LIGISASIVKVPFTVTFALPPVYDRWLMSGNPLVF